jgi:hypothetical protein
LASINLASVQLEPLKIPFHRLGCRMDVTLRGDDAAMSSDSHNRKRIHCRLSQPCKYCMTQRVQDKIFRKDRAALAVDLGRDCVAVDDLSTYRDKEILLGWQRRKEWILTCGGFLEYLTPLNVDRDVRESLVLRQLLIQSVQMSGCRSVYVVANVQYSKGAITSRRRRRTILASVQGSGTVRLSPSLADPLG